MSRLAHPSALRLSTRLVAVRSSRAALTRRAISSGSHAGHGSTSNDRPWMIGSALVFGPLFLYLVSPTARKDHHGTADHGHNSHRDNHTAEASHQEGVVPIADDEGTKVSGLEIKESIERAVEVDSPKDAKEYEEVTATETTAETTTEENSTSETNSKAESVIAESMTPRQSEPNSRSAVGDDMATQATTEGKTTAVGPAMETKA